MLRTITIKVPQLQVGDTIVEDKARTLVQCITLGRSCRNFHINTSQCYDSIASVTIIERSE